MNLERFEPAFEHFRKKEPKNQSYLAGFTGLVIGNYFIESPSQIFFIVGLWITLDIVVARYFEGDKLLHIEDDK